MSHGIVVHRAYGSGMPQGTLTADDRATAVVLVTETCGERFAAELNRAGLATFVFARNEPLSHLVEWMRSNAGSDAMPIAVAAIGDAVPAVMRFVAAHSDLVQAVVADRAVPPFVSVPVLVIDSFGPDAGKVAARWLDRVLAPHAAALA